MSAIAEAPLIFISYASPDYERVEPFASQLEKRGYNIWFDKTRLLGGQNWDFEIRRALSKAAVVVIFVSKISTDRRGYVQREIKLALRKLEEKLLEDLFVIPVLLDDDASRPDQLSDIHFLNVNSKNFSDDLTNSIDSQLEELGSTVPKFADSKQVSWRKLLISEEVSALPGFTFSGEFLSLTSSKYQAIAAASDMMKSWVQEALSEQRKDLLEQRDDFFDLGQDVERRQNTWEAFCSDPIIQGRIMSIRIEISWYNAGAAHPNFGFHTFNFFLDPFFRIKDLKDFFKDECAAFVRLKEALIGSLMSIQLDDDAGSGPLLRLEDVKSGISDWSNLAAFSFDESGLDVYFAPYEVGPYAFGPQIATVPYEYFAADLRRSFASALEVGHLARQPYDM